MTQTFFNDILRFFLQNLKYFLQNLLFFKFHGQRRTLQQVNQYKNWGENGSHSNFLLHDSFKTRGNRTLLKKRNVRLPTVPIKALSSGQVWISYPCLRFLQIWLAHMFLNNGEIRISFALFIRLKFQGFRCESVLSLSLNKRLKITTTETRKAIQQNRKR